MMHYSMNQAEAMRPSPRFESPPRTWRGKRITSPASNQRIEFINETDDDDNPAGGRVEGLRVPYLLAGWARQPRSRRRSSRRLRRGRAGGKIINRMEFYQGGKFACEENDSALRSLWAAYTSMMDRRRDREKRGVLGRHED